MIGVENLAFVETQTFDNVLVGVGMDRLFEGLAQQILAALRRRDMAVGAEHDIVGGQRVGGDEKAEIALDDTALVFGQTVRIFPKRDVAAHLDFLRHPVVGTGREVFVPGPFVLERHQLVDVGTAVDDPFVGNIDPAELDFIGRIFRRSPISLDGLADGAGCGSR